MGVREGPRADFFWRGWDVRRAHGWVLLGAHGELAWGVWEGPRTCRKRRWRPYLLENRPKSAEGPRAVFGGGPRAARSRVREGPRADLPAGGGPTVGVRGGPTGVLRRGPTGGPLGGTGGPTGGSFWPTEGLWVGCGEGLGMVFDGACRQSAGEHRSAERGSFFFFLLVHIAQVCGGPTGVLRRGPTGGPLGGTGGPTGRPSSWRRAHGRGTRRAHGRPSPGAPGGPLGSTGGPTGGFFWLTEGPQVGCKEGPRMGVGGDPWAARLGGYGTAHGPVSRGVEAISARKSPKSAEGPRAALAGAHGRPAWGYGRAHGQTS